MSNSKYHYTECGLDNIYLSNGFRFIETPRGKAVSIHDIDGLHLAIGRYLITSKRDFSGAEICFLRHEMLLSQNALAQLLGITEQSVHRWEKSKTVIPKSSESLLRLIYREHIDDQSGEVSAMLRAIAHLENQLHDAPVYFEDTDRGWTAAA